MKPTSALMRCQSHFSSRCLNVFSISLTLLQSLSFKATGQTNPEMAHADCAPTYSHSKRPNIPDASSNFVETGSGNRRPVSYDFPVWTRFRAFHHSQKTKVSTMTGGGRRVRTDDPLLAKQVLSQLSYAPKLRNPKPWWAREDLNLRPHAYQACALTN